MQYLFFFLMTLSAFAQVIETRRVETNSHTFDSKIVKVVSKYISSQERDKILEKTVPELVNKWDEVDRDLFYKSIIHYENDHLKEKYPQLSNKTIEDLREKFKTH